MYTPKHLERWTRPANYSGASWPDYYSSGFGQHRDSDALTRSNFQCAFAAIAKASSLIEDERDIRPTVVCESHWAVGWVEWIAIHMDDAEWNEAAGYWASMPVAQRMDAIKRSGCGASIFAARRAELPTDDDGSLLQYLSQP